MNDLTGTANALSVSPRAVENRSTTPHSATFSKYISTQWAPQKEKMPPQGEHAEWAAKRRKKLSALHPGERIVILAGTAQQRSNDTDFLFRASSSFAYLTGWGSDSEPGSVLVFDPEENTSEHTVTLYFAERAGRDSDEFYANPEIGEFWIGSRPSCAQVSCYLGITTKNISEWHHLLETEKNAGVHPVHASTENVERELAEFRLIKDDYEIQQLRAAVAATAHGFEDIIQALPEAIKLKRGERLIEGVFYTRARTEGNAVGYNSIVAAGAHSCVLHWTRNDGPVVSGDLILVDAGVELDSYYTADITRTLPINGAFSAVQREVYNAVLQAADAAYAVVRPGIRFRDIHEAAMTVIAQKTAEWGFLPVSAEETLLPENHHHRRYMVHETSHHLGLDVHDCAQARKELYLGGILEAGMVFTIEPGLYFQPDDLSVPEKFRGIGVRIEDNIVVTPTGAENLSAGIPRTADAVEAWVQR